MKTVRRSPEISCLHADMKYHRNYKSSIGTGISLRPCHFERRRAAEWVGRFMKRVRRSPEISRLHGISRIT